MHTARELSSPAFSIRVEGRAGVLDDVFPDFAERDRLGVVVRHACGATGASTLILAAVTAFYDAQRAKGEDFFIYPDYFLFHVGARLGDHGMLDVWPAHKEVVVGDEPEEVLRAINDRGITRLLVEDRAPGEPRLERESLASARNRVATAAAGRRRREVSHPERSRRDSSRPGGPSERRPRSGLDSSAACRGRTRAGPRHAPTRAREAP